MRPNPAQKSPKERAKESAERDSRAQMRLKRRLSSLFEESNDSNKQAKRDENGSPSGGAIGAVSGIAHDENNMSEAGIIGKSEEAPRTGSDASVASSASRAQAGNSQSDENMKPAHSMSTGSPITEPHQSQLDSRSGIAMSSSSSSVSSGSKSSMAGSVGTSPCTRTSDSSSLQSERSMSQSSASQNTSSGSGSSSSPSARQSSSSANIPVPHLSATSERKNPGGSPALRRPSARMRVTLSHRRDTPTPFGSALSDASPPTPTLGGASNTTPSSSDATDALQIDHRAMQPVPLSAARVRLPFSRVGSHSFSNATAPLRDDLRLPANVGSRDRPYSSGSPSPDQNSVHLQTPLSRAVSENSSQTPNKPRTSSRNPTPAISSENTSTPNNNPSSSSRDAAQQALTGPKSTSDTSNKASFCVDEGEIDAQTRAACPSVAISNTSRVPAGSQESIVPMLCSADGGNAECRRAVVARGCRSSNASVVGADSSLTATGSVERERGFVDDTASERSVVARPDLGIVSSSSPVPRPHSTIRSAVSVSSSDSSPRLCAPSSRSRSSNSSQIASSFTSDSRSSSRSMDARRATSSHSTSSRSSSTASSRSRPSALKTEKTVFFSFRFCFLCFAYSLHVSYANYSLLTFLFL